MSRTNRVESKMHRSHSLCLCLLASLDSFSSTAFRCEYSIHVLSMIVLKTWRKDASEGWCSPGTLEACNLKQIPSAFAKSSWWIGGDGGVRIATTVCITFNRAVISFIAPLSTC